MRATLVILLPLSILIAACTKVLDVPTPYVGDKLVIVGVLTPDSIPTLLVTRTFQTVGNIDLKANIISNAQVYLLENGQQIGQLIHRANGQYEAPAKLKIREGKAYSYSVVAAGFPSVHSSYEEVPSPPLSFSVDLGELISSPFGSSADNRRIRCQFVDDLTTKDYYSISFELYSQSYSLAFNSFGMDRPDDIEDGCGFRSRGQPNEYNLTDLCFSKNVGTLVVGVDLEGFARTKDSQILKLKAQSIVVSLRRTNQGYQEYSRTFSIESDDIFQAFDPPKVRYSNVQGGYGFIGVYSQRKISVKLTP